jgi:hypothetical protein
MVLRVEVIECGMRKIKAKSMAHRAEKLKVEDPPFSGGLKGEPSAVGG